MIEKAGFFGKIGLLFLIISCSTVRQELDPEIYYKRDMSIGVGENHFVGVAILPDSEKTEIEFKSAGRLDLFTFTNCHREITQEDADSFFQKNRVKFKYKPVATIEKSGSCPIQAAGHDVKGIHSWAFLDTQTTDAILPATIYCNGKKIKSSGVSICQSRAGLLQEIVFKTKVVVSPEVSDGDFCKSVVFQTDDNLRFVYKIARRECVFNFMEVKDPHREHRLNTIGYEEILIREL